MSKFALISVSKFMVAIIQEVGSGQYYEIRETKSGAIWLVCTTHLHEGPVDRFVVSHSL